uniref:BTB domain-containing protein n=1 Tax=Panagrolaimus sp. ES5 TaxID=591445 RepID=A0AC34G796_9BILA
MSATEEEEKVEINVKFPIAIEWAINEDNLCEAERPETKHYKFPGFPSFNYSMCFYGAEEVFFELQFQSPCQEYQMDLDLNFTINDEEPKKISEKVNSSEGFSEINLWKDLFAVLLDKVKDDEITLRCNGTINFESFEKKYEICLPGYADFDRAKADFIIAHKSVLQKHSKVFAAMFENGWKETIEGRVAIPDFPFKIVESVIELCHGNDIENDFDKHEYILLFLFVDKYDMEEIREFIKQNVLLAPNNICKYANWFYEQNCAELVNYCIDRLIEFFQYSYPVKDMDILNNEIKLQFFNQASISQVMKKEFQTVYDKNKN